MGTVASKTMSIDELADTFGVSYQTAWRWIRDGKVPSVRVGSHPKVPRKWVEETLDAAIESALQTDSKEGQARSVVGRLPRMERPHALVEPAAPSEVRDEPRRR